MNIRSPVTGLFMLACAGVAHAGLAVTYSFIALSSYPVGGINSIEGNFTLTSSHYFTAAQTWVRPEDLLGCSVDDATCGNMGFAPNAWGKGKWDRVDFGIRNTPDGSAWWAVNYYFDLGALSTVGFHDSILLGSAQAARLIVSAKVVPDPVPPSRPPRECEEPPVGSSPPSWDWCGGGAPYGQEPAPTGPSSGDEWGGAGPGNGVGPPTNYAIPEPTTYALMLAGLALLGIVARSRPRA